MTRTAAELAVERDRLLESGRTEEEVERMQRHADVDLFDALKRLSKLLERAADGDGWTESYLRDHACPECMEGVGGPFINPDWLCARHHALKLVSDAEKPTGQYAPHPPGGTT